MAKKGYSKEKADKMIEEHEKKAEELEREAKDTRKQYGSPLSGSHGQAEEHAKDLEREARKERRKAENLEELKKHHDD